MTNAATVDWIEKLPSRWARNGAIVGLIWIVWSIMANRPNAGVVSYAIVFATFIGGPAALAWLCGLGARRGLRRLAALADKSAQAAVKRLSGRYALVGAAIGLVLSLGDLIRRSRLIEILSGNSPADFDELILATATPIFGAVIGAFIGLMTSDQFRKRMTFNTDSQSSPA